MPRHMNYYQPDQLDCNTMVSAIGNDFGLYCEITTRYERDEVITLVRCVVPAKLPERVVQVQAVVRCPLKTAKPLYSMHYSALLDCWHQCDRGVLAAAARPVEHSWDGRPKQPRRKNAQ